MNPTPPRKLTERTRLKLALFSKNSNEKQMSVVDTARFLCLAAKARRYLTHYTDLKALKGILSGGRIWLTRVDLLNDLKEFHNADPKRKARTYIASFAATRRESVAMWWMYALAGEETPTGRIPVQLVFPTRAIRHSLDAMSKDVRMVVEEINKTGETKKKVAMEGSPLDVKEVRLFDILYLSGASQSDWQKGNQSSGRIYWNSDQASFTRCAGGGISTVKDLAGYIKDAGWVYEGETRMAVELSPSMDCSHIHQIAIPFKLPLEEIEVRVGPGCFAKQWLHTVKRERCSTPEYTSFHLEEKVNVRPSEFCVRFRKPTGDKPSS